MKLKKMWMYITTISNDNICSFPSAFIQKLDEQEKGEFYFFENALK